MIAENQVIVIYMVLNGREVHLASRSGTVQKQIA